MTRAARAAFALLAAGTLLAGRPALLRAQSVCGARDADAGSAGVASRQWPAPLDRTIALRVANVALRDALDRLAAIAHLQLSYSSDLLPLDRRVCIAHDAIAAGDALVELLRATSVEPVLTGEDRVVLAPARGAAEPGSARGVGVLERVVVTGSAVGAPERGLSVGLDVVDGRDIARRESRSLADALDGTVPGLWLWEQSPSSLLARYGSMRGASSFELSYPKIYIDGIEVANALLVAQLNPESVERIEVIRGPQGAALYGADAISGVINIFTRHDGTLPGASRMEVRASAGLAASAIAARSVLVQQHDLALRAGSSVRSAQLTLSAGTVGDFLPDANSRELKADGGARLVGERATFAFTGRFYAKDAGVPVNPQLSALVSSPFRASLSQWPASGTSGRDLSLAPAPLGGGSSVQAVREYTAGATATFGSDERWTQSLVAGVDGYRLNNVPNDLTPVSSAVDTALQVARGGADRFTVRASTVGQFGTPERVASSLTLALEHSALRDQSIADAYDAPARRDEHFVNWSSHTGLVAQGGTALRDALFLTGGVRLERSDTFLGVSRFDLLPMVGAAAVRDVGALSAKLRVSYGRGIRGPETAPRTALWLPTHSGGVASLAAALEPEVQEGTEVGLDLLAGRRGGLHVTRFDQRAFGLIQAVATATDTSGGRAPQPYPRYVLQNVGEISNRGWELQGSAAFGALSLSTALAFVDSRVQRLAVDYTGDLAVGDRMLGVPARTASVVAAFNRRHWSTSLTATRAFDWINYDRLRLATDLSADVANQVDPQGSFEGAGLRSYWRAYNGATRLNATIARDLVRGFSLTFAGENLLNATTGEPDNLSVVPGRTVSVGLRARF